MQSAVGRVAALRVDRHSVRPRLAYATWASLLHNVLG